MSKQPIYSTEDDPSKAKLPPELQGKSPEEIASYYQRREAILVERANRVPPAPPPERKVEKPPEDKIDLFGDPTGSVKRVVAREVDERGEQFVHAVAPGIILSCKTFLKERYPDYYPEFIEETEGLMGKMNPQNQMNPSYWEMTFKTVMSSHIGSIVSKAEERGKQSMRPVVERPTPPGAAPEKPRELTDEEKVVAKKFGLEHAEYRKASTLYDETEGLLPFTYDSKKPRQKAKTP